MPLGADESAAECDRSRPHDAHHACHPTPWGATPHPHLAIPIGRWQCDVSGLVASHPAPAVLAAVADESGVRRRGQRRHGSGPPPTTTLTIKYIFPALNLTPFSSPAVALTEPMARPCPGTGFGTRTALALAVSHLTREYPLLQSFLPLVHGSPNAQAAPTLTLAPNPSS